MYAGLPFPVRIDVELGDRRLKEGDWLTMEAPSGVRMTGITSCTVTDNHGSISACRKRQLATFEHEQRLREETVGVAFISIRYLSISLAKAKQ